MKDTLLILVVGIALAFGAFSMGQRFEKENVKNQITVEIAIQGNTNEKVSKLDAHGLCAVVGGSLSDEGECK